MFKIWTVLVILNILTIGIYSSWGQTQLRKYLAQNFSLGNSEFVYTGNGKQLFLGFLSAIPIWIVLILLFKILEGTQLEHLYAAFLTIIVIYLTFMAIYSSLRYRINHVNWRGAYGHMHGSAWRYANLGISWSIISVFSLGLGLAWLDNYLYAYKAKHIKIGNLAITYTGHAQKLFKINFITLVLAIPTLWLSRIWYIARLRNYVYNNVHIGEFKLQNTETGAELVKLYIWGFFVTLLSLGILYPLVIQRKMHYIAKHFAIIGDLAKINYYADSPSSLNTGEGLYTVMDADLDL